MLEVSLFIADLRVLADKLKELRQLLKINNKQQQLAQVIHDITTPEVWGQPDKVKELSKKKATLEKGVTEFEAIQQEATELKELVELAIQENDNTIIEESAKELPGLQTKVANLEAQLIFSGELDDLNCYLEIQSGSGGTEAQDWAQMLLRQYLRWTERHKFKVEVLEVSDGEVAGIKSATLQIIGCYAYGWLRTETGVHRLVRKSPFDSGNRRHTSFASIFVSPEIDDSFKIEINPADVRTDVYRASGAGGQHVNRTESAVRLTHVPTNTVTQCQNSRSQHANKAEAMKQLRAKLYELELKKRNSEKQKLEDSKSDIGWGSQIRSYVLDSGRIKDLRTNIEVGNTQEVLDGDLDQFMIASLKQEVQTK